LAFYYRKFIKNFAKIAMPLINLLKKSSKFYEWDEACNEAFETLKNILVKMHVLKLPNFGKDFEIHFDASNLIIIGVRVQDYHNPSLGLATKAKACQGACQV
jgi:hypothetical protein